MEQLGYWWGIDKHGVRVNEHGILGQINKHTGDGVTKQELKRLHNWLLYEFCDREPIINPATGELEGESRRSMSDMTVKEMSELMDRTIQWAAEFHGLSIQDPRPKKK